MNFVYVAIGGALGAMLRYSLNYLPVSTAFPFKTLIANIFGSFIIGMIAGVADIKGVDYRLSLLLKVGFLFVFLFCFIKSISNTNNSFFLR